MSQPTHERWLPIPGYEEMYEVSSLGRVRSLVTRGKWPAGRLMRGSPNSSGRIQVQLTNGHSRKLLQVHRLVLEAFVGPCPPGMEACHWDDDPLNNRLDNLRWGSRSENMYDRVRNGRDHNSRKRHCSKGHEFTKENTMYRHYKRSGQTHRRCRICHRQNGRNSYRRTRGMGGK